MAKFKKYFFSSLLVATLSANAFAGKVAVVVDNKIQDFVGVMGLATDDEPKSFVVDVRLIDSNNHNLTAFNRGQSATSRMDKQMNDFDAPQGGLTISAIKFAISTTFETLEKSYKSCDLFGDYNKSINEGIIKVHLTGDGKCYATVKQYS